jgi:hypothetical protein
LLAGRIALMDARGASERKPRDCETRAASARVAIADAGRSWRPTMTMLRRNIVSWEAARTAQIRRKKSCKFVTDFAFVELLDF